MACKFLRETKYEIEGNKQKIGNQNENLSRKVTKTKQLKVTPLIIYAPGLVSSKMATYYQIPQAYSIPVIVNEWRPLVNALQVQSSYTTPIPHIPITIVSPQILTPICPYQQCKISDSINNNILDLSPDVLNNISPDIYADVTADIFTNISPDAYTNISPEAYTNLYDTYKPVYSQAIENYIEDDTEENALPEQIAEEVIYEPDKDPVESYLMLPKDLFPRAKMLNIDPNPIIDEFCKLPSINENVSWILDVEFGVPRVPVTRSIAMYDVKFNSIHCKNTPTAIHPGFEKCGSDFKKVILFYYDCVISTWYRGYIILNYDKSVENFQSWLLIPMQIFGMCWP